MRWALLARPREDLVEYAERLRTESLSRGIPSIDPEDALVLYSLLYSQLRGRRGAVVVDAGAGIGYSSIWLAAAMEAACLGACRLVAIEYLESNARRLRANLSALSLSRVEVEAVQGEALRVLSTFPPRSLAAVFVDIEKHQYPRALELLEDRLEPGGLAAFHNAYFPQPPREFFEAVEEGPWTATIVPTPAGLLVAWRSEA